MLKDEQTSVIAFLDDCIQRCIKAPYRYLDDLEVLASQVDPNGEQASRLSPLIMTVLEQLRAKLNADLLSASEVLALASFTRRLLIQLAGKVLSLDLLKQVVESVRQALTVDKLPQGFPVISAAITREMEILSESMKRMTGPVESIALSDGASSVAVQEFLENVEHLPERTFSTDLVTSPANLLICSVVSRERHEVSNRTRRLAAAR
jgi:nucleolar pre-ribosomal-associated protein 1